MGRAGGVCRGGWAGWWSRARHHPSLYMVRVLVESPTNPVSGRPAQPWRHAAWPTSALDMDTESPSLREFDLRTAICRGYLWIVTLGSRLPVASVCFRWRKQQTVPRSAQEKIVVSSMGDGLCTALVSQARRVQPVTVIEKSQPDSC